MEEVQQFEFNAVTIWDDRQSLVGPLRPTWSLDDEGDRLVLRYAYDLRRGRRLLWLGGVAFLGLLAVIFFFADGEVRPFLAGMAGFCLFLLFLSDILMELSHTDQQRQPIQLIFGREASLIELPRYRFSAPLGDVRHLVLLHRTGEGGQRNSDANSRLALVFDVAGMLRGFQLASGFGPQLQELGEELADEFEVTLWEVTPPGPWLESGSSIDRFDGIPRGPDGQRIQPAGKKKSGST